MPQNILLLVFFLLFKNVKIIFSSWAAPSWALDNSFQPLYGGQVEVEIYLLELGPVAQANAFGTQESWYRTYTRLEDIPPTWYLPMFFLDEIHLITLSALILYLASLFARKKNKISSNPKRENALGYAISHCVELWKWLSPNNYTQKMEVVMD